VHGAGEAALRRQAELLQRRVLRGLVDAALEVVLVFQLAELGGHQAQHHGLAGLEETQRAEVARAVVVVLHEVGVEVHLGEQGLGHGLVVAGGRVRALEVAAAQVHGQGHAFRLLRHHLVDEGGVAVRQLIGVVAALAGGLAHLLVAQVGHVRVVHLHVGAAGVGQALQFVRVGLRHVVVKHRVQLGVGVLADARAPATEVQHGGGGDGHLGGEARPSQRLHLRLQVLEVGELDVLRVAHLVDDADHRRGQFLGAIGLSDGDRDVGLHAAELFQEVDVEVGAAELAVGDGLQPHVGLELHDLGDRAVLDLAQLGGRDLALGLLLARLQQVGRAQEAADVVGAEGGIEAHVFCLLRVGKWTAPTVAEAPLAGNSQDFIEYINRRIRLNMKDFIGKILVAVYIAYP
jgi:hypothetical protein